MRNDTEPGSPSPQWGYVLRSTGRYGSVTSHLVVYPPDTTDEARRWAHAARYAPPLGAAATTVGWLALLAAGAPPEVALLGVAAAVGAAWAAIGVLAAPVRRRSVAVWSCTSAIASDAAQDLTEMHILRLSATMKDAATARIRGELSPREFHDVWVQAYAEAAVLAEHLRDGAGPLRSAHVASPGVRGS